MGARGHDPGRRDAIASVVLAAAVVPMYLVGWALGTLVMQLLDVEEGEMLTTAGFVGWVAAIALLLVLAAPQVIGLLLGVRGRRRGAGTLATVGVIANAVIAAYVILPAAVGLILS